MPSLDSSLQRDITDKASGRDFSSGSSTTFLFLHERLTSLKIPAPAETFGPVSEPVLLGRGTQFSVYREKWFYSISQSDATNRGQNTNYMLKDVAVKYPCIHLDATPKLDLADPKIRHHLHDIYLEILALLIPSLRSHRNIVQLFAWGNSSENWHFAPSLVLELAKGDLRDILTSAENLGLRDKYQLCRNIGAGLDALHKNAIIHGDLKPRNILVFEENGQCLVKLADFGLAVEASLTELVKAGGGTPGWQAPEVRDGVMMESRELFKTDNYTFGLLIWSTLILGAAVPPNDRTKKAIEDSFGKSEAELPQPFLDKAIPAVQWLLQPIAKDRPVEVDGLLDNELEDFVSRDRCVSIS